MTPSIVLAITGASGAIYALRLLEVLLAAGRNVDICISPSGNSVLRQELGLDVDLDTFRVVDLLPTWDDDGPNPMPRFPEFPSRRLLVETLGGLTPGENGGGKATYYHYKDFMAPMASGSAISAGMVVCPCSGGTLSAIAHGTSANLIHRAAEVHLKERRRLILVPRETPLSLAHIDNMRRCTEAGAIIAPASPGFYQGVVSFRDLVDFLVARICDQLGVSHSLSKRWGEE